MICFLVGHFLVGFSFISRTFHKFLCNVVISKVGFFPLPLFGFLPLNLFPKFRGELHGKTKFTPFEGMEVEGKPILTVVRGKIMFEDGDVIGEKGHGKFIEAES